MKMIRNIVLIMILSMFIVPNAHAISDDQLIWSSGSTYRMGPTDNSVAIKEYTIKAVEFPSPVRGERTVNDTIRPERPVTPFVTLQLYKDITNNSEPIDTISFTNIGDYYITKDQEFKISLSDIPGSTSQDWVYEYYNPWATINIQKRALPNLDISINIKDIDEDKIDPGDEFRVDVKIKNTGEDILKDVSFNISPDPSLTKNILMSNTLEDTIYQLNKDEEKIVNITLRAPISIEKMEYGMQVDVTGHDVKDIIYNWATTKKIKVRGGIESITVNKHVSRNTSYLKENVHVTLNVVNTGILNMNDIRIYDTIPSKLFFIKDGVIYNYTELAQNKSSIGPSDSWTIDYTLKPTEPGVYLLPKFNVNFSIGGREFNMTSNEIGFRVFGPKVVLNKSIMNKGNDTIDVKVVATNIGNGFTRVVIEDQLPKNSSLLSGKTNLATSLDAGKDKIMNYTIRIPGIRNISSISWPPAKATYYLDDYKFTTSSDEKIIEEILVPAEVSKQVTEVPTPIVTPIVTEEPQKRVVATIPAKTPVKTPGKSIPGFGLYESLSGIILVAILYLLGNKRK